MSRLALFIVALWWTSSAVAAEIVINVVYPKAGQAIGAVDSTFIFGQVIGFDHRTQQLDVNGHVTEVHRDGGFLAFVPVTPGAFTFTVSVTRPDSVGVTVLASTSVSVSIPEPIHNLPPDSLQIVRDHNPPRGDLVLRTGDVLTPMFWGTPGCRAWFAIPGVADSVPMVEIPPKEQAFWGEAVFGSGAVPESLLVKGIYAGYYEVPESVSVVDTQLIYHLRPPDVASLARTVTESPESFPLQKVIEWVERGDSIVVNYPTAHRVSLNDPAYPFVVRLKDSVQVMRHGPRKGYFSTFQPKGVAVLIVGREGDWYKTQLSATQVAWVDTIAIERLPQGHQLPASHVTSMRTFAEPDCVRLEIPLKGKHAFRVTETAARQLSLQLFGVTSDTDWIRYDTQAALISLARWSQPEPGVFQVDLELSKGMWGYDAFYVGNAFVLQLNLPPERVHGLHGKRIVVDPGHSPDPGAIGPTGYTEAEANLGIALALAAELQRKGAEVVMTRSDNSPVTLQERPVIANSVAADLFVSVHNNALPDGVDPRSNNGTSAYYYHPHSADLARYIHEEMLLATDLPDHGWYHGNLSVARPTQYPAVLVECDFQILPEREAALKTVEFRRTAARAITRGIERFLEGYDGD